MTDKNQTVGGRTLIEDHDFAGHEFWCYFEPKPRVQCGEKKSRHARAEAGHLTATHSRGIREGLERAASYMCSRNVTASEFYAREILALVSDEKS